MNVLVTGADGLLGTYIVEELLARGDTVRVLLEPRSEALTLADLNVQRVRCDLSRDSRKLADAVDGCDLVIHAAAITSPWAPVDLTWAVNLDGTRRVLETCKAAAVPRVVCVGSASTFEPGPLPFGGDETGPYPRIYAHLEYSRSKQAATLLAQRWALHRHQHITVVSPTFMLGVHVPVASSATLIMELAKRALPVATPGGKCIVHARDVARAVLAAPEKGEPGEAYIAGAHNVTYLQIAEEVARQCGTKAPRFVVPGALVRAAGLGGSVANRLGASTRFDREVAKFSCLGAWYDTRKASRVLGLDKTPLAEAIADCLTGLRRYNHL